MDSFMIHITLPKNIGAIVVDENEKSAMNQLVEMFSIEKETCKFMVQKINWIKTEMFDKPRILFVK